MEGVLSSSSIIPSVTAVDGFATIFVEPFPARTPVSIENFEGVPTLAASLLDVIAQAGGGILSADAPYVASTVASALDPNTSLLHHYIFEDVLTSDGGLPDFTPVAELQDVLSSTASSDVPSFSVVNFSGRCFHGQKCADGLCCSEYYYCGSTSAFCGTGCRPELGDCDNASSSMETPSTPWSTRHYNSSTTFHAVSTSPPRPAPPARYITIYTTEYIQVCPTTRPCHGGLERKTYTITESCDDERNYIRPPIPPQFKVTTTVCDVCEGRPTLTVTCPIEYADKKATMARQGDVNRPLQTGRPSVTGSMDGVAVKGGGEREQQQYLQTNAATKVILAEMVVMIGVIALGLGGFVLMM